MNGLWEMKMEPIQYMIQWMQWKQNDGEQHKIDGLMPIMRV